MPRAHCVDLDRREAVGDLTAADGLFNGLTSIEIDAVGSRHFVALFSDPGATTKQSPSIAIAGVNAPSDAQLQQDEAESDAVTKAAQQVLSAHGNSQAA